MHYSRATALVFALIIAGASSPCLGREPYENQWGPFVGRVVDASTGKPIPGAVFVAMWLRRGPLPPRTFFDARVAVADADGRFELARRDAPNLSQSIDPPSLDWVAPGYGWHHEVGAQNLPMAIQLQPLRKEELVKSLDPLLGTIPRDHCKPLQNLINDSRRQLGLRTIAFCSGNIEKAAP